MKYFSLMLIFISFSSFAKFSFKYSKCSIYPNGKISSVAQEIDGTRAIIRTAKEKHVAQDRVLSACKNYADYASESYETCYIKTYCSTKFGLYKEF